MRLPYVVSGLHGCSFVQAGDGPSSLLHPYPCSYSFLGQGQHAVVTFQLESTVNMKICLTMFIHVMLGHFVRAFSVVLRHVRLMEIYIDHICGSMYCLCGEFSVW